LKKKKKESFTNIIENVAKEKNYYPKYVETRLEEIESYADPIFEKIRSGRLPDTKGKKIISIFINVMISRVPHMRKWLKEKVPDAISESQAYTEKKIKIIPEKIDFKKRVEREKSNIENQLSFIFGNPWIHKEFVLLVSMMKWVFYYVQSESKFITSDNPVTKLNEYGLYDKEGKLFFPISSNVCLVASLGNDREEFMLVPDKDYEAINHRTASNATRFIYYHEERDWVKKFIRKSK